MCEGPIGMIKYLGPGKVVLKKKELQPKKRIGLVAGGSGVTPMFAIAQASSLAKDGVEVTFLFTNKTKDDILIKDELDNLAKINPNFKVFYTLTRHKEEHGEWDGLTGRISMDMLKNCGFPEPADDVFIATCGPKEMNGLVKTLLSENGYVEGENYP